jgi:hypothetical protein
MTARLQLVITIVITIWDEGKVSADSVEVIDRAESIVLKL